MMKQATSSTRNNPATPLRTAWGLAFPIVLGYLPIGFAFGILADKAGLSNANTLAMSILVYAGSAQLIAVGMFSAALAPATVILTTLVVNLRHLLMSAALSPYLGQWKRGLLPLFAFELTDETFAVHSLRFPREGAEPAVVFPINLIAQLSWVAGTFLGLSAGALITDVKPLGLDYALPAMFIALLVFQVKDRRYVIVAAAGGLLSVILLLAGVSQWNVILATLAAATLGIWVDSWTKPASS